MSVHIMCAWLYSVVRSQWCTTSHHALRVCARAFTEIGHDANTNMIGMQYATPWPWHVLIPWSLDHVISHPSHLVILAFHVNIIIPMQVPCQSVESFARNPPIYSYWFSPIIPSIISSPSYASSLPWFYFQNLKGKPKNIWENIPCPIDPSPLKIWSNFHSKSSFEFNEVNWIQIHWNKSYFEFKSLPWISHMSLV
jgi:hypothetical protein